MAGKVEVHRFALKESESLYPSCGGPVRCQLAGGLCRVLPYLPITEKSSFVVPREAASSIFSMYLLAIGVLDNTGGNQCMSLSLSG